MELSSDQQNAIDRVAEWHAVCPKPGMYTPIAGEDGWDWGDAPQVFRLFGYAGTGKTTIAKQLAERIGGQTVFMAFTGKAASVLDAKGCKPAMTIHQAIYTPVEKSLERLADLRNQLDTMKEGSKRYVKLKREIEREEENCRSPYFSLNLGSEVREKDLIILDECSMVDEQIARDLMSFGRPILVLGDPAQLPPVGGAGYFINAEPDVMLTEIHRQAADNPILQVANEARKGKRFQKPMIRGTVRVIERDFQMARKGNLGVKKRYVDEADQIICGMNKTRNTVNKGMRKMLGYDSEFPSAGERLICLQNNHDLGVLNGHIFTAVSDGVKHADRLFYEIDLQLEGADEVRTFKVLAGDHTKPEMMRLARMKGWIILDYGYAITCHKSQGSEWDTVLVVEESGVFRDDASKWLYTAVTRAAKNLIVAI